MTKLTGFLCTAMAVLIIGALAFPAGADVIEMNDGRVFEGRVVKEDHTFVYLDTVVSGIRATLPLRKRDIVHHQEKPLPPGFFDRKPDPEPSNTSSNTTEPEEKDDEEEKDGDEEEEELHYFARIDRDILQKLEVKDKEPVEGSKADYYLEIPLTGAFGDEIWPAGIQKTLEYAHEREQIKDIVFVLDSPGGYIWAADEIKKLIRQYQSRFVFHCVVRRAISASIWVVFSSDTIWLLDGSTVGGATVYSENRFGEFQVEAKMLSITAAELRALADSKGHPSVLVSPMIIMDTTVAAWRDDKGRVQVAQKLPRNVKPQDVIFEDTSRQVLTLTQREASEVGLGRIFSGSVARLGRELGKSNWMKYNDAGSSLMEQTQKLANAAAKEHEELTSRWEELVTAVNQRMGEAQAVDPRNTVQLMYHQRTGRLTPNSIKQWREASERCIRAWMRVQEALVDLRTCNEELESRSIEQPIKDFNLQEVIEQCENEIRWLRANRIRTSI